MSSSYTDGRALAGQHVAIVGASSGVGLALARLAAAAGARLTLFGRDMPKLRSVSAGFPNAELRQLDLHRTLSIEQAVRDIVDLDHLAVTAGTFGPAPLADTSLEHLRAILEERIIGPLMLVKTLAPQMRKSVVLFSGGLARRPLAGGVILAAALCGVEGLARALAVELAPIRVNVVAPGVLDTPMLEKVLGAAKDHVLSQVAASVPARRAGSADDAAHAALFLMTNVYMTAAVIEIDGGAKLV